MLDRNHSAFAGESVTQWRLRSAVGLNFPAAGFAVGISSLARKPLSQRAFTAFFLETD
jgi:hypothetical protein